MDRLAIIYQPLVRQKSSVYTGTLDRLGEGPELYGSEITVQFKHGWKPVSTYKLDTYSTFNLQYELRVYQFPAAVVSGGIVTFHYDKLDGKSYRVDLRDSKRDILVISSHSRKPDGMSRILDKRVFWLKSTEVASCIASCVDTYVCESEIVQKR